MAAEWEHIADIDIDNLRLDFSAGGTVWNRTVVLAGNFFTGSEWDEPTQNFNFSIPNGATLFLDLDTLAITRGPDLPLPLGNFPGLDDGPEEWIWPLELVTVGDIVYLVGANSWTVIAYLDMTDTGAGWQYTHGDEDWWIKGEGGNTMILDNDAKVMTDGEVIYHWGAAAEAEFGNFGDPGYRGAITGDASLWRFDPSDQSQEILVEWIPTLHDMPPITEPEFYFIAWENSAALFEGRIFALMHQISGGGFVTIRHFFAWDLAAGEWGEELSVPIIEGDDYSFPFDTHPVVWNGGRKWVVPTWDHGNPASLGIVNADEAYDRRVLFYDFDTDEWTRHPAILPPPVAAPVGSIFGWWHPPYGSVSIIDEENNRLLLIGGEGGHRQGIIEDTPGHWIIDPDNDVDTYGREIWALDLDLSTPPGAADFNDFAMAIGTPAHVFLTKEGGPAQPQVTDFTAFEQANGGMVAMAGRIRQSDVDEYPAVLREDALWRAVIRETGELLAQGITKEPGPSSGVVDISADGVGRYLPAQEFDAFVVYADTYSLWNPEDQEPSKTHDPPDDGPEGYTINGGTGSLAVGNYRYAVAFVTAEGESALGPDTEIPVLIGEDPADIHLRKIALGGPQVTARKIYRHDPGFGAHEFRLLDTIADNTTEVYDDSTASVAGNALGQESINAGAVQTVVDEDGLVFLLQKDVNVLAAQRAGFVWTIRGSDVKGQRLLAVPNRDLSNWELRIATAPDPRGPWTHEQTIDMAGAQSKRSLLEFVNDDDVDAIRIELRRKTDGADDEPLKITIETRVYGVAPVGDDDFTTSDVVRVVCRELGVSDAYVKPIAVPAGPQIFVDSNWGAVLDMQALLSGFRWLFLLDGDTVFCDFHLFARRRWLLRDPEVEPDLLPQPRYSRVKVYDQNGILLATATAHPNTLGRRKTKKIALPFRVSTEVAQALAQVLADYLVQRRWAGELIIPRVYSITGTPASYLEVHAGDEVWVPKLEAWVPLDEYDKGDAYGTASVTPGLPLLDRFIQRVELMRAAAS